ncbi:MAG: SDR family oxidoreductase [Bryobacteraceae bacterium]|nr:SDR family oxidoreductase [Bryobacteraceae bacterium]
MCLVTGGSRGLGLEIADGLAEAGGLLMLAARREQWLAPAVDELRSRGFPCEGAVCDASNPEQVQSTVERTISAYGRIDVLVNCAGVSWAAPAEEMPLEKWKSVLDVNLTGAFLFCQAAGRRMIEQQFGRILNVASIAGIQVSLPRGLHYAAYVASKGGLIALTRELAAKWAQHNIRVNAVAPGFFATRLTEKVLDRVTPDIERNVPMGRIGRPGELKGAAVFLVAPASDYVTGQTLIVDGGGAVVWG